MTQRHAMLVERQHFHYQSLLRLLAGALVLVGISLTAAEYLILRASWLDALRVHARIVGDNSGAALLFRDRQAAAETLGTFAAASSVDLAILYTVDGVPLVEYRRPGAAGVAPPPRAPRPVSDWMSIARTQFVKSVSAGGSVVGTLYVRANPRQLHAKLLWFVLATTVVLCSAFGLSWAVLHRMQRAVAHAEERVSYLAYYDPVTHLPNRHAFNEYAGRLLAGGAQERCLALLFMDLDDFKVVNDTLGHPVGDMLLQAVAERFSHCVRQDDRVYRVGGDEFAMMLADDEVNAAVVAEKLIRSLSLPFQVGDRSIYLGISIGISLYPRDGDDVSTLLRNADAAMYSAKEGGKNGYCFFSAEMQAKAAQRLALESDSRHALERGEFEVHYQPIVSLADECMVAVEALLRWKHPVKGWVRPDAFIPLAEVTGLIVPLGAWALRTACAHAQAWNAAGHAVKVSVNLSGRQFRDEKLVDAILDILCDTRLSPHLLVLEITESILMEHADNTVERLNHLRDMGVYLSIDDFGTGYSSMAYLKRFPVSTLKIDQSFIRDVIEDSEDAAIVSATIEMAHRLRLGVVAEGVENAAQADFLRSQGCDFAQGYRYGRPTAHAELATRFFQSQEEA